MPLSGCSALHGVNLNGKNYFNKVLSCMLNQISQLAVVNAELTESQVGIGLRKERLFCPYYSASFHRRAILPCF